MTIVLMAVGLLVAAAGFVAIGFGIPINAFSLGNTLILAGASFILAVVGGVAVGVLAASRQQTVVDRAAMGASLVVGNMPPFWLGLVLIVFFAINLRWPPGPRVEYMPRLGSQRRTCSRI